MGPAIAIGAVAIPAILITNNSNDDYVQDVNHVVSSPYIGGTLKEITRELIVNNQTREIATSELEALLRNYGVPEHQISLKSPKIKLASTGNITSVSFVIDNKNFEANLMVLKSRKTSQGRLQITVNIENFKAIYQPPQIQHNWSNGGVTYEGRGLTGPESSNITSALKAAVDQAKPSQ